MEGLINLPISHHHLNKMINETTTYDSQSINAINPQAIIHNATIFPWHHRSRPDGMVNRSNPGKMYSTPLRSNE
jgi:hypothetical protein